MARSYSKLWICVLFNHSLVDRRLDCWQVTNTKETFLYIDFHISDDHIMIAV